MFRGGRRVRTRFLWEGNRRKTTYLIPNQVCVCVCVSARKCTAQRFYLYTFSKKHNHHKSTVAHIHAPTMPAYPYKDPSVCTVCHPQRPPCGCVTNHAGNELGASSGNSTSYLSTSAQI